MDTATRVRALALDPAEPSKAGAARLLLFFARQGTTLAELAGAAGLRWSIEECFQRAKRTISALTIAKRDPDTVGTGT